MPCAGSLDQLPADTVLAYEPPANHAGVSTSFVLFADGRVERIDVPRLQRMVAMLNGGTRSARLSQVP